MEPNDGGPAFPCPPVEVTCSERGETWKETTGGQDGMSLRDWFAGQALAGMRMNKLSDPEMLATLAYAAADAMLRERDFRRTRPEQNITATGCKPINFGLGPAVPP